MKSQEVTNQTLPIHEVFWQVGSGMSPLDSGRMGDQTEMGSR